MIALFGYAFMYGLIGVLCATYDTLDRLIGLFGDGLLQAIGALDSVLAWLCGNASGLPVVGWLASAICVAVRELFTAVAAVAYGFVIVTGFMIRFAVATTFSLMMAVGMAGAWLIHWILGRGLAYDRCVRERGRTRDHRSMLLRFVVLSDAESPRVSRLDSERFESQTREHLLRECMIDAHVSWTEVQAPTEFKIRGITRRSVYFDPFAYLRLMCLSRSVRDLTIFFVDSIRGLEGLAFPVCTNFCLVEKGDEGSTSGHHRHTPTHELTHLADVFWHHAPSFRTYIMRAPPLPQAESLSAHERCLIRTSRFCRRE